MASLIVMPKLGLTMKEGQLVKWNKAEGDEVNPGEVLFEVATDKLTNTVEANEKGFMRKLLANEGDVIPCLKPVAIIGDKDEDRSALLWESPEKGEAGESSVESGVSKVESRERKDKPKRVKVSPIAKKLAMENNIDVYGVAGTGPNGRITKEDVENICIKAIEVKIFELLDALCMKNLAKALGLYESLLTTNEPPMRILFMITRQFRLIYKVKLMLKDNANTAAIGNQIGLRGFVVNNLIKQSKYFSLEVLKQALEDCLNADISIKTGKMDGKLALEMILVKYGKKKA